MSPMLEHAVNTALQALAARYGSEWDAKWQQVDAKAVRTAWLQELTPFTHRLEAITWALSRLPDRCPNAMQFRRLCEQAPLVQRDMPEEPKPVRGPTAQELQDLRALSARIAAGGLGARPGTEWAFAVLARHERGENVSSASVRIARDVVNVLKARWEAAAARTLPDAYDAHPSALEPDFVPEGEEA